VSVEHFNEWYAAMDGESRRDRLWQELLDLPPELVSTSLLSMSGLREIADLLELGVDDVLLDLACGRGGYGLWLARETGCRVLGVDFSEVAVADARDRIQHFALEGRADFRIGELEATGLPDASVDAVLCVDAIQFAEDTANAMSEVRRVLKPGGLAVVTSWEARDRTDEVLPERIRNLDVAAAMTAGGLVDVAVVDKPEWRETEQKLWDTVMAIDAGDDQGLTDAQEEGAAVSTTLLPRTWRVLATGRTRH
jgi:ubiquinone/menaquinone biosynthesis C-methylase UbiE